MAPEMKLAFVLCLFATSAVQRVVPNPTNPTASEPGNPATPEPAIPTDPAQSTTPESAQSTTPESAIPTDPAQSTTPEPSAIPTDPAQSTTPGTTPLPTDNPDICARHPCPARSTCEARANQTRVCLCMAGDYYDEDSRRCETAKVFPGQLQVPGLAFEKDMRNKTSPAFQRAAEQISDQIGVLFNESSGYLRSIVLELKPFENGKGRAGAGVGASVEMVFQTSARVKTQDVVGAVAKASECVACLLANSTFTYTSLCMKQPCDEKTTTCSAGDDGNFLCRCSKAYVATDYSHRACVACPSGQTPNGTRQCIDCPFGYSGFNCAESWKLALVIVGSVLGGLLLIAVAVLIVTSTRSPKKTSKRKKKDPDTGKPDVIHFSDKDPLVTSLPTNGREPAAKTEPAAAVKPFVGAGVPRIPRATAAGAWDGETGLEMTPSNSRHGSVAQGRTSWRNDNLEDMNGGPYSRPRNQTDPYAQTRPLSNPYSESRSLNNPYARDRPRTDPYARNQGQSNPNFSHDNERPFNY
ncbi:mucin-13-like [Hippocampus comes]|uniref:mucin-13-like n=1 Tax=Hippocampus comes TaxID=109280 RepID=UPI00094E26B2|nr:PREDICTED: mucin-13-like [Hippocampus comes]